MISSIRGAVCVVVSAASLWLWSPAQAQGTGTAPPGGGEYTPGIYGNAQLAVPNSLGALLLAPALNGCDWSVIYGSGSSENFAFPESNATYWQASLPLINAAGTAVRIDGRFPDARFFSISLYNGSYQLQGTLQDYGMTTSKPDANPYANKTQLKAGASRSGAAYTAYVVFGSPPPKPAPNTLYVPPQLGASGASLPSVQQLYLLYRVYRPAGPTASGGEPLPALSINGAAFSGDTSALYCQNLSSLLAQSILYSIPLTPGQAATSAPTNPTFTLYKDSGIPGQDAGVNGDNQYMSASATLPAGYLYLIRGKAPTYTGSPLLAGSRAADVRYWSICQNTSLSLEVVACVGDFQATLDTDGYYNIVVTGDTTPPVYARGFNWMPFGTRSPATVIYRQLLAADHFSGASGSPTMGAYTPQLGYCKVSQFQTLAAAYAGSPKQVFIGCGGTAN